MAYNRARRHDGDIHTPGRGGSVRFCLRLAVPVRAPPRVDRVAVRERDRVLRRSGRLRLTRLSAGRAVALRADAVLFRRADAAGRLAGSGCPPPLSIAGVAGCVYRAERRTSRPFAAPDAARRRARDAGHSPRHGRATIYIPFHRPALVAPCRYRCASGNRSCRSLRRYARHGGPLPPPVRPAYLGALADSDPVRWCAGIFSRNRFASTVVGDEPKVCTLSRELVQRSRHRHHEPGPRRPASRRLRAADSRQLSPRRCRTLDGRC